MNEPLISVIIPAYNAEKYIVDSVESMIKQSYSIFSQETQQTKFYGKEHFLIEGTIVAEHLKESPCDRLPASYKELVRTPVWDL